MRVIKALFFDLDGVLTTDARGHITTCRNFCALHPALRVDDVLTTLRASTKLQQLGKQGLEALLQNFCNEFAVPFTQETLAFVAKKAPWNDAMLSIAYKLRERYLVGIITDNPGDRIGILSQEPQLRGHFEPIIVSGLEKASKSDGTTTIYDRALERSGCSADQAVFIDNQERNLVTPATMGIKTYFHDDAKNDVQALRNALKTFGIDC